MNGEDAAKEVRSAYEPDDYQRLSEIKAVYDPDTTFRLNHNIPPVNADRRGRGPTRWP